MGPNCTLGILITFIAFGFSGTVTAAVFVVFNRSGGARTLGGWPGGPRI